MQAEPPWQDLRDKFLAAAAGHRQEAWLRTWRLLLEHPWFQHQLGMAAARVLRTHQAPPGWKEEVVQDTALALAERLRRKPDLGVDPALAQEHFAGWMRRIVTRICVDAVRRLERHYGRTVALPEQERVDPHHRTITLRLELDLALEDLPFEERTIVTRYAAGSTLRQIARELNLSYWQVYRRFQAGVKRLRAIL